MKSRHDRVEPPRPPRRWGHGLRARAGWSRMRDDAGQALVEFLVVAPLLLMIFFGIVEVGGAWRTFQVITNTAREGARQAVLPGATEAEVLEVIRGRLQAGGLNPNPPMAEIQIVCDGGAGGTCFGATRTGEGTEVRIAYRHNFVLLGPVIQFATGGGGDRWGEITMRTGIVMRNE